MKSSPHPHAFSRQLFRRSLCLLLALLFLGSCSWILHWEQSRSKTLLQLTDYALYLEEAHLSRIAGDISQHPAVEALLPYVRWC